MGLAADVIAYLDANWATGTGGTEPTWLKYDLALEHLTEITAKPDCLVEEMTEDRRVMSFTQAVSERVQVCRCEFKCTTRADAELKEAEMLRLIPLKSVTSGWWEVTGVSYGEFADYTIVEVVIQQTRYA